MKASSTKQSTPFNVVLNSTVFVPVLRSATADSNHDEDLSSQHTLALLSLNSLQPPSTPISGTMGSYQPLRVDTSRPAGRTPSRPDLSFHQRSQHYQVRANAVGQCGRLRPDHSNLLCPLALCQCEPWLFRSCPLRRCQHGTLERVLPSQHDICVDKFWAEVCPAGGGNPAQWSNRGAQV